MAKHSHIAVRLVHVIEHAQALQSEMLDDDVVSRCGELFDRRLSSAAVSECLLESVGIELADKHGESHLEAGLSDAVAVECARREWSITPLATISEPKNDSTRSIMSHWKISAPSALSLMST